MCRLKCYTYPFSLGWGSRTFTAPAGELGNWTFPQQESNPWIYESPKVSWATGPSPTRSPTPGYMSHIRLARQLDLPPTGVQPLDI